MERNEQLAAMAAAVLSVAIGIGLLVAYLVEKKHHGVSGPAIAVFTASSFLFAVALVVAGRAGNRFGTGMVAVVGGFFVGRGTLLSFPFLALAAWLLVRNSRALRAERDAARAAGGPRARPTRASTSGGSGLAGLFGRRRRTTNAPDAVRRPPPSKRYTPPRPPSKGARKR